MLHFRWTLNPPKKMDGTYIGRSIFHCNIWCLSDCAALLQLWWKVWKSERREGSNNLIEEVLLLENVWNKNYCFWKESPCFLYFIHRFFRDIRTDFCQGSPLVSKKDFQNGHQVWSTLWIWISRGAHGFPGLPCSLVPVVHSITRPGQHLWKALLNFQTGTISVKSGVGGYNYPWFHRLWLLMHFSDGKWKGSTLA